MPLTPAIVRVTAGDQGGTGTLIAIDDAGNGYVLTARHVTLPYRTATATFRNGYSASGPVIGTGEAYDTSVFRIQAPANVQPIPVAETAPEASERVDVFGYGGQSGPVSEIRLIHWSSPVRGYASHRPHNMLLDPICESGDSGGPVIYQGHVVGVMSHYAGDGYGRRTHAGVPPCTPIRNLLRAIAPHVVVQGADAMRAQRYLPGGS